MLLPETRPCQPHSLSVHGNPMVCLPAGHMQCGVLEAVMLPNSREAIRSPNGELHGYMTVSLSTAPFVTRGLQKSAVRNPGTPCTLLQVKQVKINFSRKHKHLSGPVHECKKQL